MKVLYLITGTGSMLIMTSYQSLDDNNFLQKLTAKGIEKFLAYNIPVEQAKKWYGNHFSIVEQDLMPSGDLRVLDYNGSRVFERLNFSKIDPPHIYDKAICADMPGHQDIYPPINAARSPL